MTHELCTQTQADLMISSLPWPAIKAKLHRKIEAKEICWDHAMELYRQLQKPDFYQEAKKAFPSAPPA